MKNYKRSLSVDYFKLAQDLDKGLGIPVGGTTNQVLSKASDSDRDGEWRSTLGGALITEDLDMAGFNIVNGNRIEINDGSRGVYIGEGPVNGPGASVTTANASVGIGYSCLQDYQTGGSTVAVGDGALSKIVSSNSNTALGNQAMQGTTSGNDNAVVGHKVTEREGPYNRNAILGSKAMRQLDTGNNNTAIGYQAGRFINGGAINASSTNATLIGSDSKPLASSGTGEIVIGAFAVGNGSNTATLGRDTITDTYLKGAVHVNNVINLQAYTVATLPAGSEGDLAYVTDATSVTWRAVATGGGSDKVLVFFDGTNWIYQ